MIAPTEIVSQLALFAFKASVIFAAAFVASALLRQASAATRHLVWLAAFGGVLALPVVGAVMPALRVPVLARLRTATTRPVEQVVLAAPRVQVQPVVVNIKPGIDQVVVITPSADVAPIVAASVSPVLTVSPVSPVWSLRLVLLWIFGSVMVAVAFAVGVLRTHLLACQAAPAIGDVLADEAEVIAAELGIVRDVRVLTWDGPTMPMTWGAIRPVILLPESARNWPAERRREVLTHELAHVSRGDWAARILAALICSVQWFNPLAWMAARRMRDEQELACDDTVLALGAQPSTYAAHLLEVARSLRAPVFGVTGASVAMARPSQLTGRLLAMLDASRQRTSSRFGGGLVLALTLAVVLPVSAISAGTGDGRRDTGDRRPVEVPVVATAAAAPTVVTVPTVLTASPVSSVLPVFACDLDGRRRGSRESNSSHSSSSDDGAPRVVTLSITQNGCTLEVRLRGNVTFNNDESDIAEVPQGASVRVTEEFSGSEKRFEMSWAGGRLQRRFWADGSEVAETADQRAWLKWVIQTTFMRTGYNTVPRAIRAYRAGGLDSALALANATTSDYVRRQVAMALIDSVHVPAAEAVRVAMLAEDMSSDYERSELLIAVARKMRLDGEVQDVMVTVASHMSSDYERGRTLTAALARTDLSAVATTNLLRVAGQMSSDYEKVELLIRFLRDRPFDEARRASFFTAANSISSDYEKRRLLSAALARIAAAGPSVGDITSASTSLSSDFERAELLVQVAQKFGANADVRAQVLRASGSFSSDHEKSRVLGVLARTSGGRFCVVDGTATAC